MSPYSYLVSDHHVPLPDEFDQISRDLHVFRAFSPTDLRNLMTTASNRPDTFTLKVVNGDVIDITTSALMGLRGANDRVAGQLDFIKGLAGDLEGLEVVYSVHDTPSVLLGWEHRQELNQLIEEGECELLFKRIVSAHHGSSVNSASCFICQYQTK